MIKHDFPWETPSYPLRWDRQSFGLSKAKLD